MKPWIKRTLVGLFGASVLFGGLAACSHHGHRAYGWQAMSEEDAAQMKGRMVDRVSARLELNEAQRAKLATLADTLQAQRQALMSGGRPRDEFAAMIGGSTFDRAKAQALVQSKTGAVQAKSPEVIAAFGDFFDSLTPEQQNKVREFLARGGRHGWRS